MGGIALMIYCHVRKNWKVPTWKVQVSYEQYLHNCNPKLLIGMISLCQLLTTNHHLWINHLLNSLSTSLWFLSKPELMAIACSEPRHNMYSAMRITTESWVRTIVEIANHEDSYTCDAFLSNGLHDVETGRLTVENFSVLDHYMWTQLTQKEVIKSVQVLIHFIYITFLTGHYVKLWYK